jgi:hypothetical protein
MREFAAGDGERTFSQECRASVVAKRDVSIAVPVDEALSMAHVKKPADGRAS